MKRILDLKFIFMLWGAVLFMAVENSALAQNYIFDEDMDAITVRAKKSKSYKRVGRKEKDEIIEKFKRRLKDDFPDVKQGFEVESDYVLYQDTMIMTKGYLSGRFIEMPKAGVKNKDSLAVIKHKLDEYINARLADNMKELEEGEKILSNREEFAEQVHRMLWGVSPYKLLMMIEELNGKWDYLPDSNTTAYITFRGDKGFMGIYRIEWKLNFLVERNSLSLLQLVESIDLKVSIPFGVKMDDETVENINKFNIAYSEFDALKFRRGLIDFKRYVEYYGGDTGGDIGDVTGSDIGDVNGGDIGDDTGNDNGDGGDVMEKAGVVRRPKSKSVDLNLQMEVKKRKPIVLKALCNMEIQ